MTMDVYFEQRKHLGVITLDRPNALNALTFGMIQSIEMQLKQWAVDSSVHAVIIRAEGEKAFCAGGDVRWLYDQGPQNYQALMDFFAHEYRLNQYIHEYPKPYIALLQGITMGGGVGVGLHGSHAIAAETFKFAMPETTIGFFPDVGASHLLARCPGALGLFLGLTGQRLGAQDALFAQLVDAIVPYERFNDVLEQLLQTDLTHNVELHIQQCIAMYAIDAQQTPPIAEHMMQIDQCFAWDSVEAIVERLDMSQSTWATTVRSDLLNKSPLSLKVTLEQLRRTKSLSMAECIKIDYDLAAHFMAGHDFFEGVRALLVDKDKTPRWQPSSLSEVTSDRVAGYFELA